MTTVVIPVYSDVTQLDFTSPHQFLTMIPDIEIIVASIGGAPVSSTGLVFSDLADLEAIERCDVLLVPGGLGCVDAMDDVRFMGAVRRLADTASYLTSVCSGSLILAAIGALRERRAACHWAWRDMLPLFGAIPDEGRVVRDGMILTGGGVTAGADFALALIAELRGDGAAQAVQLALEYAPAPPFNAGTPATAPAAIRDAVAQQMAALLENGRQRVAAMGART